MMVWYKPETVDWVDRNPPDIATLRLGDVEIPIAHFTMTMDSPPCQSWSSPNMGPREITGQITCTFDGDLGGWRPNTMVMVNRFYRALIRSTMTKRQWRRWRGKDRTRRRAARIAAAAAAKRPDLHPDWWERRANEALTDLPPGADYGEVGSIVDKVAPGWDFVDATAIGDSHPRVALATYDPESPL
jgi:hypothetical protein